MKLVIGSGPAGIAAAHALLERGQEVTLLDTGLEMDERASAIRTEAKTRLDAGADLTEIRHLVAGPERTIDGALPMKTIFGSDFPYRSVDGCAPLIADDGVDLLTSYARGGLSNLWGANVLPFSREELASWPVPHPAMEDAYRAVMPLIRLSAMPDDGLADDLPLYTDRLDPRYLSRQAIALLDALTRRRTALANDGVIVGASRLGVATEARDERAGCTKCGLCLDGCPGDLIWNSARTLAGLRRNPRLRYVPGVYARCYQEYSGQVRVTADALDGSGPREFIGDRLFVGCGALSSARLVMESAHRFDEPVRMLDSLYFIQPWLRWRATPGVTTENLTTLSQLCIRLDHATGAPVHILIYTYNDFLRRRLAAAPLPVLAQRLLNRIVVAQGYLHSNDSPGLEVTIAAPTNTVPTAAIRVRALPNSRAEAALHRARRGLRRVAWHARATPVPGTLTVGRPGKGYHFGGGFPMRQAPKQFESDVLGRPFGSHRVHLVDASCFPNIPATNLTLTVMANAWRIATESCAAAAKG